MYPPAPLSPALWVTQLRRAVAVLASHWRYCIRFDGLESNPRLPNFQFGYQGEVFYALRANTNVCGSDKKKIFATFGILCSFRANVIHKRLPEFRSPKIFAKFNKIFAKFCEWSRSPAVICEDFSISQIAVEKTERRLESVYMPCRFLYLRQNKSRIMQHRSVDHTLSMTDKE